MVTRFRRWLSGVLGHAAFHVNPDPSLSFTTTRRVEWGGDVEADHFDHVRVVSRPNPMPTSPPPGFAIPENDHLGGILARMEEFLPEDGS